MKKLLLSAAIVACAALGAKLAIADEASPAETAGKWEFSLGLASVAIDSEVAQQNAIDDSAIAIGLTADYDYGKYLATIGFDLIGYDDNAGFRQRTTGGFGGDQNSSSDASGMLLSVAGGPKWHVGKEAKTMLYVQGGYALMIGSERSIANCSNCYSEDIEVDGGVFAKAGVLQNVGKVGLGLFVTQFLTGDGIDGSFGLSISTNY